MPFALESNVPLPTTRTPASKQPAYPFAKMKVGDSFLITDEKTANKASAAATAFSKANPAFKFTRREVTTKPEAAAGTRKWRIWRIAAPEAEPTSTKPACGAYVHGAVRATPAPTGIGYDPVQAYIDSQPITDADIPF